MKVKFLFALLLNLALIIAGCKKAEVVFKTVKIGNQVWMAENLNVDHYRNGDQIPEAKDDSSWKSIKTGAWCYYNNDPENGKKFGKLYNWYAVNDPRGLAPKGWHIPTSDEFTTLSTTVSGDGNSLKAVGRGTGSGAGTNTSGFSALLSGARVEDGTFDYLASMARFWSSSESEFTYPYFMYLHCDRSNFNQFYDSKVSGFSVRCIKD